MLHDRVCVIDRAGEHARELGATDAVLERGEEPLRLVDRRLVVLGSPQLEEDLRVLDVARELLEGVERLLNPRPLAVHRLGLAGVVPEAGGERLRV